MATEKQDCNLATYFGSRDVSRSSPFTREGDGYQVTVSKSVSNGISKLELSYIGTRPWEALRALHEVDPLSHTELVAKDSVKDDATTFSDLNTQGVVAILPVSLIDKSVVDE